MMTTELANDRSCADDAPSVGGSAPIFILCAPRSGSTLLRLMLDSHPVLACPPETNIGMHLEGLHRAIATPAFFGSHSTATDDQALTLLRRVARDILGTYARIHGKQRWIDKSLQTINAAPLLLRLFPDAQFICLYRECADSIASLLEACPYGFNGYGLARYVLRAPENLIAACAMLWLEQNSLIASFEASHSDRCHRVLYEDLVTEPEHTAARLWGFLAVEPLALNRKTIFSSDHTTEQLGDYKIWYTRDFDTSSIGRGSKLPLDVLAPSLRASLGELSVKLGYALSTEDDLVASESYADEGEPRDCVTSDASVQPLRRALSDLLERNLRANLKSLAASVPGSRLEGTVRLKATDADFACVVDFAGRTLRFLTPHVTPASVASDYTLSADAATLHSIASGLLNPGLAARHARLCLERNRTLLEVAGEGSLPVEVTDERANYMRALLQLIAPISQPRPEVRSNTI